MVDEISDTVSATWLQHHTHANTPRYQQPVDAAPNLLLAVTTCCLYLMCFARRSVRCMIQQSAFATYTQAPLGGRQRQQHVR
jgi:hypothetical protein